MIASPGRFNPFRSPERCKARRDSLLRMMAGAGQIDVGMLTAYDAVLLTATASMDLRMIGGSGAVLSPPQKA